MIKVGITGGIATGKSFVANIIRDQKIPVISADIISREVVEPGETSYQKIVTEFGDQILNLDKTLNRKKLGEIVFNDPKKLSQLNQIIQPEIFQRIIETLSLFEEKQTPLIFVEIPLLFENDYQKILDQTWVVTTDPEKQIEYLIRRDNISKEQAQTRIQTQMTQEDKIKLADIAIDNSKSENETKETVIKLLSEFSYE